MAWLRSILTLLRKKPNFTPRLLDPTNHPD